MDVDVGRVAGEESQSTLSQLLNQSHSLTAHLGNRNDLPHIQLGLDQIESQTRRLLRHQSVGPSSGARASVGAGGYGGDGVASNDKAAYFLASAGIDAASLGASIARINTSRAFEPLSPIYDTDIDAYLKHSHEQLLLSSIEEGRRETQKDFAVAMSRGLARDWSRQRARALEEMGGYSSGLSAFASDELATGSRAGQAGATRSLTSNAGSSTRLHGRMMKYDEKIRLINHARSQSRPVPVVALLGSAVSLPQSSIAGDLSSSASQTASALSDTWKALSLVVGEEPTGGSDAFDGPAIRARQYALAYTDEKQWNESGGQELRRKIATGARRFLQHQFDQHIDEVIALNPVKAQLGGVPSVRNRVTAFIRVIHQDREGRWDPDLELVNTAQGLLPLWAIIFHLLRTGNEHAALDIITENDEAIQRTGGSAGGTSLVAYFKAWMDSPERLLPKSLRDRIVSSYNATFRGGVLSSGSSDGYKQGLYRLLGRIDIHKRFPVVLTRSTENWLWVQLSLIRDLDSSSPFATQDEENGDGYGLVQLGNKLLGFGEKHFDPKGARPLHYFQILLLSGQFEQAVAFLYSRPQHQVDAVQFAAALSYYGLLRVPSQAHTSATDLLTIQGTEPNRKAHLDFAKLVERYVRSFARSDARSAFEYIALVCLNEDAPKPAGPQQVKRCHELIRGLVLESRQYFDLLGEIRNDGTKAPGLIERNLSLIGLSDSRQFLQDIVCEAASQSDREHRVRDAILLYNLAEEYNTVIEVLNRDLGVTLFEVSPLPASSQTLEVGAGRKTMAAADPGLADAMDTAQLAKAIVANYERQEHILRSINPAKRETIKVLLALKDAVNLFHAGELEKSLNTVESLDLIPLSKTDAVSITRQAEKFREISPHISKNVSNILLLVMETLYKLHEGLIKSSALAPGTGGTAAAAAAAAVAGERSNANLPRIKELRAKARALMVYAGSLRLRIEQSVFAQLTRLDVFIH
ncbi:NIC-domain-containing protein [Ceraceosorus guamensis]|uniref:Nuclear pore protein n=1 Tax=Ceraceosorus guamensis TaxID=1522189 RepID=A0A316W3Z3_9BASI|nr:NIC-domain-containing protein [Ceraceosorus guamensis]PWN43818.1 NIC-domain-containing protein [Ceraceosorus guamensis]